LMILLNIDGFPQIYYFEAHYSRLSETCKYCCPKHVNIFDVYFLKNKNLVFALENGLL